MQNLIWIGALVSLVGVGGLVWCILAALRARRSGVEDAEMKAKLQKVVLVNMVALVISAIGLMLVILGIMLG